MIKTEQKYNMDFVNNNLTMITPVRIANEEHLQFFKLSIESYYKQIVNFHPKHIFSINADVYWMKQFQNILDNLLHNYEIMLDNNASQAFVNLIDRVDTKYLFMMFGDVMAISDKDIFSPSLESMELRNDICQVNVGGFPVGDFDFPPYNKMWNEKSFPNNSSHFHVMKNTAKIVHDNTKLDKMPLSTGDAMWIMQMLHTNMKFVYPFPFWANIMKSDVTKKIIELSRDVGLQKYKEIRDFLTLVNETTSVITNNIHIKGFPKEFQFVEEYSQGLLNLACYMYSIEAERKPLQKFKEDHCREWK